MRHHHLFFALWIASCQAPPPPDLGGGSQFEFTSAPVSAEPATAATPARKPVAAPARPPSPQPSADDRFPAPPDVAAPPPTARRTATGLSHRVLEPGTGKTTPRDFDEVTIHFTGWKTDGSFFDSSRKRNKPLTHTVSSLLPGWSEAIKNMVTGEKRRLWVPQDLAYRGKRGAPTGTLVFDIELISIQKRPEPPKAPADVAAAPADAAKTKSGLATKVLVKGTGTRRPTEDDSVEVHYTGWKTDGTMFDSSVARGRPASFPVTGVIGGWTEALQLMVEGEKRRLWIPEPLAYKGLREPKGMLVFDVELLSIKARR